MCTKKLQILIVLLLIKTLSFSQSWHKLSNLSYNVTINQIETSNDGKIYVLTGENFPFYSTDGGANWQPFTTPPNSSYLLNARRLHVNKSTNRVFFGTNLQGVSYTSNLGNTWGQEFFTTNSVSGTHEGIGHIASSNDTILLAGGYDFGTQIQNYFYSTNNGNTWSPIIPGTGIAEDMIYDNAKWIVATGGGLKVSTDLGATWNVLAFSNSATFRCWSIVNTNANGYYCVVYNIPLQQHQIYQSNNLSTWNLTYSFNTALGHYNDVSYAPQSNSLLLATREGLMQYSLSSNTAATISTEPITEAEEAVTSNAIYYGTNHNIGVRTATAPAYTWTSLSNGLYGNGVSAYMLSNSKLYATSSVSRLVSIKQNLSMNNWDFSVPIDTNNFQNPANIYLKKNNTAIFTGGNTNIFKSTDDGASWTSITAPSVMPYNTLGYHNFNYFNATKNNQLYISMLNDNGILRRSTNNGASWDTVYSNFNVISYTSVVSDGNLIVYASYFTNSLQNKLIKSTDGGNTWTDISHPFLNTIPSTINLVMDNASNLYIASSAKIYQMPSQGVFNPVDVPWDTISSDINRLNIAFDLNNKMVVNASGQEFCSECGVYRYNYTTWENLMYPNLVSPNTPMFGLELLYDSIPLVRSSFGYNLGSYSNMGYYYYGSGTVDVNEIQPTENTFIYPNPTNNILYLNSSKSSNWELINEVGQVVLSGSTNNANKQKVDISALQNGIYFLKVQTDNSVTTHKVLKN